ncbi:hypothetical protein [Cellulomonas endophytica]|uniref:hypothetical protein n=1 Tax=Cellulomonas endophytica TaxID=2494735 RepID=UPI001F0B9A27|nr:hypothetical protein [Cellulomonas endophytica]
MLGALALVVVLLVVAVGAVLRLLDGRPEAAPAPVCRAELDGTGWLLSPEQAGNAALLAGEALRRGLPARAVTIAVATTLQESRLVNITYGDRDSLGLFQQRPSQGWGSEAEVLDPVHATGRFYDALVEVDGWQDLEVTVAAQAVQRSGFPDAYAQHETRARAWASALTGFSPRTVTCTLPADGTGPGGTGQGASDGTPAGAAGVLARLERDLGPLPTTTGTSAEGRTTLLLDPAALVPGEPERAGWAAAQWAVAAAGDLGVLAVEVGDALGGARWDRTGEGWTDAPVDAPPPGQVRLTLA